MTERVLILDDDPVHAEEIRQLLVNLAARRSAKGNDFALDKEDVETATHSSAYVARWRGGESCRYDLVICDLHMTDGSDEGALPVLKALNEAPTPPLLVVMTQKIGQVSDPLLIEVENLAKSPKTSVPCVVMSKHKSMTNVADKDIQRDPAEWRDFFLRAVANRNVPEHVMRLQRESKLYRELKGLPALSQAFADCIAKLTEPVLVVISEPDGLFGAFAGALSDEPPTFHSELGPERFSHLLLDVGWAKLREYEAVGIGKAKPILQHASTEEGRFLREQIRFLLTREIIGPPGQPFEGKRTFAGQLILHVTPEDHDELDFPGTLYRDLPKVRVPAFSEMREKMIDEGRHRSQSRADLEGLIKIVLRWSGVTADPFDLAVMAAYDWSLGFNEQSAGIAALRLCAGWMAEKAEVDGEGVNRIAPGLIVQQLTQHSQGRQSIYAAMDEAHLLLYILRRLHQEEPEGFCLQAAAFLYFKQLCTTGSAEQQKHYSARFYGGKNPFEQLKGIHKFRLGHHATNGWPTGADKALYGHKLGKKTVSVRMQERLAKSFASHVSHAPPEVKSEVSALWDSSALAKRKNGAEQLGVLASPYKGERTFRSAIRS